MTDRGDRAGGSGTVPRSAGGRCWPVTAEQGVEPAQRVLPAAVAVTVLGCPGLHQRVGGVVAAHTEGVRQDENMRNEVMVIEVMCRVADGPLRPGELKITQTTAPLVSWSVDTRDVSEAGDLQGRDLAIELHFPDATVWTGEAYSVADAESDPQAPGPSEHTSPGTVQLRGIGALSENSIPVHSDVAMQRIEAMVAKHQH
jgi:hypothetical protein